MILTTPGGRPTSVNDAAKFKFDDGRDFRRFQHDRAARSECRGHFPRGCHQREIPRHDKGGNTRRFQTQLRAIVGIRNRHIAVLAGFEFNGLARIIVK